jgi:hypothetical protein
MCFIDEGGTNAQRDARFQATPSKGFYVIYTYFITLTIIVRYVDFFLIISILYVNLLAIPIYQKGYDFSF